MHLPGDIHRSEKEISMTKTMMAAATFRGSQHSMSAAGKTTEARSVDQLFTALTMDIAG